MGMKLYMVVLFCILLITSKSDYLSICLKAIFGLCSFELLFLAFCPFVIWVDF